MSAAMDENPIGLRARPSRSFRTLRSRLGIIFLAVMAMNVALALHTIQRLEEYHDSQVASGRQEFQLRLTILAWQRFDETVATLSGVASPGPPAAEALKRATGQFRADMLTAAHWAGSPRDQDIFYERIPPFTGKVSAIRRRFTQSGMGAGLWQEVRAAIREERSALDAVLMTRLRQRAETAAAQADMMKWWILGLLFAPVTAATALWLMLHFMITRRVEKLTRGAEAVAKGKLDGLEPAGGRDELAVLSCALTEMTGNLRARIDAEERLRQRLVINERLAATGELAAAVAHALGNPLASIRASAQYGAELSTEPGAARFQNIIELADRMKVHLQDLLSFAREGLRQRQPVDINEVLANVVTLLQPVALSRHVILSCDLLPGPLQITADAGELERALLAIVENAIEASENAGEVRLETSREGPDIRIEVKDRGPGIPSEIAERIFDPFYSTKDHGRGLGLTVARRVAESLDGELRIDGTPDGGTVVVFRLHGDQEGQERSPC